ncbi:hypothetical protein CsatA_007105 [Cannabis sativa]
MEKNMSKNNLFSDIGWDLGENKKGSSSSELEELQKEHEEKISRIEELKKQIEYTKVRLEKKTKSLAVADEDKMEAFKTLTEKYNIMRQEYNTLLLQHSTKSLN